MLSDLQVFGALFIALVVMFLAIQIGRDMYNLK